MGPRDKRQGEGEAMTVPQLPRQRREMREGVAKLKRVRPFIFITASFFFCVCV